MSSVFNSFKSLPKHFSSFLISIMGLLISFSLLFLEGLLLPWDDLIGTIKSIIPESLTLLSTICMGFTASSLFLSTILIVHMRHTLNKEKSRLDVVVSYLKIRNDIERNSIYLEKVEQLMKDEYLTRKEYEALLSLCTMTKDSDTYDFSGIITDSAIDNAKTALEKVNKLEEYAISI